MSYRSDFDTVDFADEMGNRLHGTIIQIEDETNLKSPVVRVKDWFNKIYSSSTPDSTASQQLMN